MVGRLFQQRAMGAYTTIVLVAALTGQARAQDQDYTYYHWAASWRYFYINEYMDDRFWTAIYDGFVVWNGAGANFQWYYGGSSPNFPRLNNNSTSVVDLDYIDRQNVGAQTYTIIGGTDGRTLLDADVIINYTEWLNGRFTTTATVPAGKLDVQSVMAHEAGHAAGMAHDFYYTNVVMYYVIYTGQARRVLTTRDISSIKSVYGTR